MKEKQPNIISNAVLETLKGDSHQERVLHRLHCVTLVLSGLSSSEVARIYDDSPRAVAYWVERFKRDGLQGLHENARPGRPAKLNQSQLKKLQTFLSKHPEKPNSIKAEILAEYISKEFDVTLTVRQCWRIVDRLAA